MAIKSISRRKVPSGPNTAPAAAQSSPISTEREPVSEATEAVLRATDEELTEARSILGVLRRSLDHSDYAEEQVVLDQVLQMLTDVSESIEFAGMGCPQKAPFWPAVLARREALEEARQELAQRQEGQPS